MENKLIVTIAAVFVVIMILPFLNITGYAILDNDVNIIPLSDYADSGEHISFQIDLGENIDTGEGGVEFILTIKNLESGEEIYTKEEIIPKRTITSFIRTIAIPEDAEKGEYSVEAAVKYQGEDGEVKEASDSTNLSIGREWYKAKLMGYVPMKSIFIGVLGLIVVLVLIKVYYNYKLKKRKYQVDVLYKELPSAGVRSCSIGKVAETDIKTYYELEKMMTHTMVAGATGGGKTIAAQVLCEEALQKNVSVIVFDPTAQWTGYLRKCKERKMLKKYSKFGLNKHKDAKAFKGNIYPVSNHLEIIDIKKYVKPGQITIFTINKLDNKQTDIFIANTIRQVFNANFDENSELKLLLVYDEVHRLLPKFGGSGMGFIQIERACREFRKWGVGLILISQVLSDFIGEVKANISTEIQMRTRDEGDLNRIKSKYGEQILKQLIKESTGVGMVENPDYNKGKPYLVNFRPIFHSVTRLTDKELDQYTGYNSVVDDIEYQLEQLEEMKQDVFDMKLELKLAKSKIESGQFNMVDIYLEGLKPKVEKLWKKLKKTPKKKVKKLVDQKQLKRDFDKAQKEREKWFKAQEDRKKKEEESKRQKEIDNAKEGME